MSLFCCYRLRFGLFFCLSICLFTGLAYTADLLAVSLHSDLLAVSFHSSVRVMLYILHMKRACQCDKDISKIHTIRGVIRYRFLGNDTISFPGLYYPNKYLFIKSLDQTGCSFYFS